MGYNTPRHGRPSIGQRASLGSRVVVAGGTTAVAAGALAFAGAGAASAAPMPSVSSVSAVTHVLNRPDSGNGGTWAYDSFARTLTVTRDPSHDGGGKLAYTATVTDKGTFSAVQGSGTPNQADAGEKVAHAVKGTFSGGISYTVTASPGDHLTAVAAVTENDHFAAPSGEDTTASWPEKAFASPAGVTVTEDSGWSWTYSTGCESWTDSSANGDGNLAGDGNITGRECRVPVLSHGQGVYWEPTREKVTFEQSQPSWDEFTIVGPGFNGQHGWVDGMRGLNTAYYEGLSPHHGYTVLYTPVTGPGSTHQVPGTHTGYVYFVSDTPPAS